MANPRARPFLPPNFQPSPPINRTYSGPAVPTAYDVDWQVYNNLTPDQIAWFQSQPEWQNFVAWVALDPPNATIHANAPDMTTIMNALTAANVTAAPLGVVTPVFTPSPPTHSGPATPLSPAKPLA